METLLEKAYSIENKENDLSVTKAGSIEKGNRRYDLYTDEAGKVWYSTMIQTEEGWKTEEEAIFGRMMRRRK